MMVLKKVVGSAEDDLTDVKAQVVQATLEKVDYDACRVSSTSSQLLDTL